MGGDDDLVYDDLNVDEDDDAGDYGDIDAGSRSADQGTGDAEDDEDDILLGINYADIAQGFFKHTEPVFTVGINPSRENVIVSGGGDGQSFLWDAESGDVIEKLTSHSDSVVASSFSYDGQFVAVGSMDGCVSVSDATTGKFVVMLEGPSEVVWLSWHPRGNVLVAGSEDGTMWMWQVPSGSCMNVFSGHVGSVTSGSFTPDGRSIISGGQDGNGFVWDPKAATIRTRFQSGHARFLDSPITSTATHHDSQIVLYGGEDGSASLVHIGSGKVLGSASKASDSIETVGFCLSMPLGSVGSVDGTIAIWDLGTMVVRDTYRHMEGVTKVVWQENAALLTSCSLDQTVRVWDSRTGSCERSYIGHTGAIFDMACSKDGGWCVTGGDDKSALIFQHG
ncbi:quinon protein alcohol dehydrogenase-like superfamily [Zopfochytrium polystomum]|nr:quinon protein alcohol dehydrogenase-like superfamily [Zopfochytrium polystomum]